MEKQIRSIINEVFYDMEEASAAVGESLDAESLADCVGDRMSDSSEEYRALPWERRRALVLNICKQYV